MLATFVFHVPPTGRTLEAPTGKVKGVTPLIRGMAITEQAQPKVI